MTTKGMGFGGLDEANRVAYARELAKRWKALVASGKARWLPGMRMISPTSRGRVIEGTENTPYMVWHGEGATTEGGGWHDQEVPFGAAPDFNDPATLGCLLALARERWGNAEMYTTPNLVDGSWFCSLAFDRAFAGETEVEAILTALEAAP